MTSTPSTGQVVREALEAFDGDDIVKMRIALSKVTHAYQATLARPDSVPNTDEAVSYVLRYGSGCRGCADENGVCLGTGLPCEVPAAQKAIRHVIRALNYGLTHGFLAPARPDSFPPFEIGCSVRRQGGVGLVQFNYGISAIIKWSDGNETMEKLGNLEVVAASRPDSGGGADGTTSEAEQVRCALANAGQWFRDYERQHRAKGTPDADAKAETNAARALLCEEAAVIAEALAHSRLAAVEAVCAAIEGETGRAGRNLPSYNEGFVDGADDAVDRIRAALKGPTP